MRFGVRLGIDPGDARIGVASSDPSGFLATPVETVRTGKGDVRRIAQLVTELEAVEVVIGLPRSLNGTEDLRPRRRVTSPDGSRAELHPSLSDCVMNA